MLDLRQLRQFIAVAEAEHVGRAAEALNMSQSPLSRQMMQLEQVLGLVLFERVRKRIRLSRAGREFLIEAQALVAQAERLEARARRIGRGEAGTLAVGYVDAVVHAGVLTNALRKMRAPRPDIHLELRALRSGPQLEALRRREIDCGFVHMVPADDPDLDSLLVLDEPMLLALPHQHALAAKHVITPSDLDGRPWIDRPRALNPAAHDRMLQACIAAGFRPDLRFEATDPATSLALVAAGLGFALVQASMRTANRPREIALIELPWLPLSVRVYAVWRKHPGPLVRELIACLAG